MVENSENSPLLQTPLTNLWIGLGARMVPFGGYLMPVQFADGVLKEHLWTRQYAGLFDVSHMGPAKVRLNDRPADGDVAHQEIADLIEKTVAGDVAGLARGQLRYMVMTNADGGVIDDLFVGRPLADEDQGSLYVVVNAGTKDGDFALIEAALGDEAELERLDDRALIAIQGPKAVDVIPNLVRGPKNVRALNFMHFDEFSGPFGALTISRSGYTGEDGFEVLVAPDRAEAMVKLLLAHAHIKPIGLGARDSLRLEAGLCLNGHDLDPTTTPIEAGLGWTIQKPRRERGGFPGATEILSQIANGPPRKRIGLLLEDKAPAREGTPIHAPADQGGHMVGLVTSGGFGPSLGRPVAMGYVDSGFAAVGTKLDLLVRGQMRAATVTALPFVAHNYVKPKG